MEENHNAAGSVPAHGSAPSGGPLTNYDTLPLLAEYVAHGKTVILPLRGFSMRPYLEDGRDKALMAAVPETLHRGDVILARLAGTGGYALHRITRIDGDTIVMCGDGNFMPESISRRDVMALAKGFYRKGSARLSPVDSLSYKAYWHLWLMLKPFRRYLLFAWKIFKF